MGVEWVRRPEGLGEPLGRYSHISIARGTELITVAGQVGITSDGELAGDGSLGAQTAQAFRNVVTALASLGLGPKDVFKTTTLLVGNDNLDAFMQARTAIFEELFGDGEYPPNTLLVISRLVEERFLVEVEAFAMR
ncbi:MAG TPA: RidA family protein [Acidimicrobiales bacterium]|nr:RidA family protein [Acidimicrobiales bacterium]